MKEHLKNTKIITVLLIVLLIVAGIGTFVYLWNSGRDDILEEVTFEAGDTIDIQAFVRDKNVKASFADDSHKVDTAVLGKYDVSIKSGIFTYKSRAVIEDTVPPTASAVSLFYEPGKEKYEAKDFVENVQDKTKTTIEYVKEPDYEFHGKQNVEIKVTDAGNNSVTVASAMITRSTKSELTLEIGSPFPKITEFMLNAEESAVFVTDIAAIDVTHPNDFIIDILANDMIFTTVLHVVDTVAPVVETKNLSLFTVDTVAVEDFIEKTADATGVKYSLDKEPDMSKVGEQSLTIIATDEGNNSIRLPVTLTVSADTEPPVITANDIYCYVGDTPDYKSGVKVTDNHDKKLDIHVDSSSVNTGMEGCYSVQYSTVDMSGNVSSQTVTVYVVRDTEAPVISGVKDIAATVGSDINYMSGVKVTDNHDKDLSASVDNSQVNVNQPGTYVCTYTATDSAGNVSSVSCNVTITEKPVVSATDEHPYAIYVNKLANCVTVYTKDANGEYTVPYTAFVCSCGGSNTPVGTFQTTVRYRWRALVHGVHGQYATRIVGSILFHSVPYTSQNVDRLQTEEFNKLGETASAGCVRLMVADAKWIYDNCPSGTKVVIYNDENPGPLGKPVAPKITDGSCHDPTQ